MASNNQGRPDDQRKKTGRTDKAPILTFLVAMLFLGVLGAFLYSERQTGEQSRTDRSEEGDKPTPERAQKADSPTPEPTGDRDRTAPSETVDRQPPEHAQKRDRTTPEPKELNIQKTETPGQVLASVLEMEKPGQVSAAVYDADGRLVRTLLRAEELDGKQNEFHWNTRSYPDTHAPLEATGSGVYRIHWDGIARDGTPVPPGKYTIKLLRKPPFRAEFMCQVGCNPNSKRHHRWVGNHSGGTTVDVDDSGMYIGARSSEGPPAGVKQSIDGTERYWKISAYGNARGAYRLASNDAGKVYRLLPNGVIEVLNASTGKKMNKWRLFPKDVNIRHTDIAPLPDDKIALIATHETKNVVRSVNNKGETRTERTIPTPRAVTIGPEAAFVISETRVLRVSPSSSPKKIVDGLTAPKELAVDPTTGDLLVVEGAPNHQVKRFDQEGNLKQTYGRKGGRQEGPYDPTHFLKVRDIAADNEGGFVVTEPSVAPVRVAHFDADGNLVNEWYGAHGFFPWHAVDPRDPTKVWFASQGGWVVYAEVNYDKQSWEVLETHHLPSKADGICGQPQIWNECSVRYHNGERYLMTEGLPQVFHHKNGELIPLTASDKFRGGGAPSGKIKELTGTSGGNYYWADANGDRRPQGNEIVITNVGMGGVSVAPDASILYGRGNTLRRLALENWYEGVPQFPITEKGAKSELIGKIPDKAATIGNKRDTYQDAEGNYYALSTGGADHTGGWPDKSYGGHPRFIKWDDDGKIQWSLGKQALRRLRGANNRRARPGTWHEPADISGESADAVFVTDRVKNPGQVYSKNGLYLGYVGDTRTQDGRPAHVYETGPSSTGTPGMMGGDSAHGGSVAVHEGDIYWFAPESQAATVYRIHGWEDWQWYSNTITIDREPEGVAGEGNGLQAQYYSNPGLEDEPATNRQGPIWYGIDRGTTRNTFSTIIDGNGINRDGHVWGNKGPAALQQKTNFSVRWRGEVEAEFSEAYRFSVYARGGVRLWINGKQRIWRWGRPGATVKKTTKPIALSAGERVSIQLEFRSTADFPACSLIWESFTQDRERIPKSNLYPKETPNAEPVARPATKWIDATNFGISNPDDVTGHGMVEGYRGRNFASDGAYVGYELDFGSGVSTLEILMGYNWRQRDEPELEFRVGGPDGKVIGKTKIKQHEELSDGYHRINIDIETVSGVQKFYIIHRTSQNPHIHIKRFRFK